MQPNVLINNYIWLLIKYIKLYYIIVFLQTQLAAYKTVTNTNAIHTKTNY